MTVGSVKLVLEGDLGVVDCYTGSDTGVIFLSEAAVVNLSDTLQRKLKRLAQVFIEARDRSIFCSLIYTTDWCKIYLLRNCVSFVVCGIVKYGQTLPFNADIFVNTLCITQLVCNVIFSLK